MISVALRFSENFSPDCGTIAAHRELIDSIGHVWYGKMGAALSDKTVSLLMENTPPKILLIHSGGVDRYWATVDKIQRACPEKTEIPEYYRENAGIMKTWFRVTRIEDAPKNIMSLCKVKSSGVPLGEVSKSSMSPYFIIEYSEY